VILICAAAIKAAAQILCSTPISIQVDLAQPQDDEFAIQETRQ